MAVWQWVVVFPKRVRYFLNIDAGCLNRVAGIVMREVHRFGAALNAHEHMHLFVLDGVLEQGRSGLVFRGAQVDEACAERVQAATRLDNGLQSV